MSTPVLSSEPEATPPSANLSGVLALMEDLVSEVAEESRAKTTRYRASFTLRNRHEYPPPAETRP